APYFPPRFMPWRRGTFAVSTRLRKWPCGSRCILCFPFAIVVSSALAGWYWRCGRFGWLTPGHHLHLDLAHRIHHLRNLRLRGRELLTELAQGLHGLDHQPRSLLRL